MIQERKAYLETNVTAWNLPRTGEWNCVIFNNYHPHCTNIDLLWFHSGSKHPLAVAKLSHDDRILRREYQNLIWAHQRAEEWTPKPLVLRTSGEFTELWMTGVPGLSFESLPHRERSLGSLADTIAGMHSAFCERDAQPAEDRYERAVLAPVATMSRYGDNPAVRSGCADLARRVLPEWIASLPVIPQHGDLFAGNVISAGRHWRFLDWECLGAVDLPYYDLFTLLMSELKVSETPAGQWSPALVKQIPLILSSYTRRLGLKPEDVRLALPLALLNWFHVQTVDGRDEFSTRMYRAAIAYFQNTEAWNRVFCGA